MKSNLDDEARAELLCYLVVGQLVARARTGEWLRTDHLVSGWPAMALTLIGRNAST
ncbi:MULTISPECIES: hypothetical protein [Paraburkholderia]|uniref:hypothetical protein n=1 Tax=Paraburkholderia TaxID=1822464 RepID=UPI002256F038|nr:MULTISPECIES: hypothetical protein [Paraburkholderia]MCX4156174.1 hypothetical protein [Paraburkholderia aspalathi]MDN7165580.1 hypothetical protein [Paraburkholderia sp. SECH2]MDQ6394066.1 hypothetical protein [Paraburkholderia aspalathi]